MVLTKVRSSYLVAFLRIIFLAPCADKMSEIPLGNRLPELARWSYLVRSGLPAVSHKKNVAKSHIINPLLTKLVRSRWLDIGLFPFFWTNIHAAILTSHLVNNPYVPAGILIV